MADQKTAEAKLARLRDLVAHARSMPMSASCVMNRQDVLAAIDDVIDNLPDEIAEAQDVIENSRDAKAAGEAQAERIAEEARERAAELATETEVIKVAQQTGRPDRGGGRGRRRRPAPRGRHVRRRADGQLRVGAGPHHQPGPHRSRPAGRAQQARPARGRRRRRRAVRPPVRGTTADLGISAPVTSPHRRLDRRSGLVLDTHDLGRRAGEMSTVQTTVPAPNDLGIAVIRRARGARRSSSTCGSRRSSRACW